jgi:hypothetical protein
LGDAQRASGVTGSQWRKYEIGAVEPKLTQLLRIQRAFGFASLELLFGALPTAELLSNDGDL